MTYKAFSFDKVEAQLNHNVVFIAKNFCNLACNPSVHAISLWLKQRLERCHTNFFMTSTLTFCISTFWLNSGGNFVVLRSFASTLVAIVSAPPEVAVDECRWFGAFKIRS
jgi:hypothetical protein